MSQGPQGRTILDYRYAYDRMDNITTKQTEHGAYRYAYDELYRLTQAENPTLPDEAFTYDPVGNRLTSKNVEGMWSYNPNNELEQYDAVSFRYDANGNTVEKVTPSGVSRYGYNVEDRMVGVRDDTGNLIATYAYDPFGRRLWKDVAGEKVFFLYSDEGLIAEFDGRGKEIKTYGYKPGSTWTTDPVFMKKRSKYYFFHNDHLGAAQKITNQNGDVLWTAVFYSFGGGQYDKKVFINFGFPGQYKDEDTGLHYNYHRYYDSRTGRYLKTDPIGSEEGLNLYAYVHNNPINYIDSQGLYNPFRYLFLPIRVGGEGKDINPFNTQSRKVIGKAVEIEQYTQCVVTCTIPVLVGEAATQAAQFTANKVAKKLAKKWVKNATPYIGWVSTAYSSYKTIECFVDCKKKEDDCE